MTDLSPDTLRAALRMIRDPFSSNDIVAAGLVEDIQVKEGLVQATLLTDRTRAASMEPLRREVESALRRHPGVTNATVILTAHKAPPPQKAAPTPAPAARHGHGAPGGKQALLLPDVKAIVAVASGKGGVGKSTVAVNLAVSLSRQGLKVGLLDADIYGPSLPRMIGMNRKPEVHNDKMVPLQAWGLSCMSIGFLVDEETPMIWRGPMVMGALEQMMGQVEWGALDILVVDMPPGTGDAQLTMAQRVALTGAVIVSTPQDIALIDARRGVRMFEKTQVPVLGLVENMSFYCCPNCGHRADIFRPRWRPNRSRSVRRGIPRRDSAAAGDPQCIRCRHADLGAGARKRGGQGIRRARRPRMGESIWQSGAKQRAPYCYRLMRSDQLAHQHGTVW